MHLVAVLSVLFCGFLIHFIEQSNVDLSIAWYVDSITSYRLMNALGYPQKLLGSHAKRQYQDDCFWLFKGDLQQASNILDLLA